jgi:hypothetical protein
VPYEHIPLPGPATPTWLRETPRGNPNAIEQDR